MSFSINSKGAKRDGIENSYGRLRENEQGPHESEQMPSVLAIGPTVDEIRQRAFELHLEHGCTHGRDHDDWLEAERDLIEKHQAR